jgi:predicted PurR-regulated permease PerM
MLNLDDRTGNILTTIALFAAVVAGAFAARATLVVFVLALLLAYVLEPAVGWVQGRLPARARSRAASIAVVYLLIAALAAGAAYVMAPAAAEQMRRLAAAVPEMRARLANSQVLARHGTVIAGAVERAGPALAAAAEDAGWLLLVPLIAVFFLNNREELLDDAVRVLARRREQAGARRTIAQVDAMLGQYTRAQLATAGLSMVFYTGSLALLQFPYPLALGILGGALEFLPVVGWIIAAATMLASGWVAHAPWLWMGVLIGIWRIVLNVVISPRILGDRLRMEPITVFFALMAGGQIGGVLGVILSVPLVAVLRILWLERSSAQNSAAA